MLRPASILSVGITLLLLAGCGGGGDNVTPPTPVETITISPAGTDIDLGQTAQLTATAHDADGNDLSDRSFTWSSSVPSVATVPGDPVNPATVTSVSIGTSTITATSEGKSESVLVEVKAGIDAIVLTGRVVDGVTDQGIAGASITIERNSAAGVVAILTTGADGSYTSPAFDQFEFGLLLTASAAGYASGRISVNGLTEGVTNTAPPLPLAPEGSLTGAISGTVRNARTGDPLPGTTITLSSLSTAGIGETHVADASGGFTFTGLSSGTYELAAENGCCVSQVITAIAVGDGGIIAGQDFAMSPTSATETRIVLTWGSEPSDLDAHLTGPNADASRFHVYYPSGSRGNLTGPPFAALDLDDISSFGPETITITQTNAGVYRYSVHDFTNRGSAASTALARSGAKVEVYVGGSAAQHYSWFVPNQPGTLWTVFELTRSGSTTTVTPINQVGLADDPSGVPIRMGSVSTDAGLIRRAVDAASKR